MRRLLEWILLASAFFLLGRLGLSISMLEVTPVWPPSGVALAAVLLLGYRVWPGIWIGAFLLNLWNSYDPVRPAASGLAVISISTGSTLAALVGAYLVERFAGGRACLERARWVLRFLVYGALFSTLFAATWGAGTLVFSDMIPEHLHRQIWFTWWVGDLTGVLVVGPLLLAWTGKAATESHEIFLNRTEFSGVRWKLYRWFELLALLLTVTVVSLTAFGGLFNLPYHLEYMLIPCLVWSGFRFDARGATSLTMLVSALSIWGTIQGYGSFVAASVNESLLQLQLFMCVIAMTTLVLVAVLTERRHRTMELVRAMQDAREAQQEADEANRARSVFLANMSHELRTPLNHIIGYSDLLREEIEDEGKELLPDVEKINTAGRHLMEIIGEILDLSLLETGKMEITPVPFTIQSLVEELRPAVQQASAKNDNSFSIILPDHPVEMLADKARLRQVLLSLLDNACKFTHNGSVTLEIAEEPSQDNSFIRFAVHDTGIGITSEQMSRLFQPFTQLDSGTTKKFGGTGLGLAISKLICDRMGGSIHVSSEPEKGSVFIVRLPLRSS